MRNFVVSLLLTAVILAGCVTVKQPDGTTTTSVDTQATILLIQTAVNAAEQALAAYIEYADKNQQLQDREVQREIERQRRQLDMLTTLLESLKGTN